MLIRVHPWLKKSSRRATISGDTDRVQLCATLNTYKTLDYSQPVPSGQKSISIMHRRSFLKSTVALAVAMPLPRILTAADATPTLHPRVKIGFLGVAHSHAMEKVKVIRESPAFELVGICEASGKVRERYVDMDVRFISEGALFKECTVVAVESDVRDHARHARLALEAGKHVHVEKPPADSLPTFQQLVTLARDKQLLLQVGYMWRYNPGMVTAMEAARKGWLGDIYLVRGTINTTLDADRRPEWAEFKGGAMFELGCHLIDTMVRLLGRPNSVTPSLHKHGNFTDNLADNTVAVFGFGNATGIITSSTLGPNAGPHRFFEILGTSGAALLKPIEPPTLQIDLAKAAGAYAAGNQTLKFPPYRRYVGDFDELAEAVRAQRPLTVSLEEELAVQQTLIRACEM